MMVPNSSTGEIRKQEAGAGRYISNQRWAAGNPPNPNQMNNMALF